MRQVAVIIVSVVERVYYICCDGLSCALSVTLLLTQRNGWNIKAVIVMFKEVQVDVVAVWGWKTDCTLHGSSRVTYPCVYCRCQACLCGSADSWSPWVVSLPGPWPCWPACWCRRSRSSPPTPQLSPSSCPSFQRWYDAQDPHTITAMAGRSNHLN